MIENMIEIELNHPDDFLIVKETLTRIGVPSFRDKTLYQSCHILHKRGKYYIAHFKEMFLLDEKLSTISEEDFARRNTIATLLEEWDLIKIIHPDRLIGFAPTKSFKIIPAKEKHNWQLESKYTIGVKHF